MTLFPCNPGSTHSSVLEGIRDPGNRTAWQRFFDQYAPYIHALARRRGLRHADAEDVVQTVLSEIVGKMREFDYDRQKGRFHVWLAEATRYRVEDALRRNVRLDAHEISCPAPDVAAPDAFAALAEEEWLALVRQRALERLRKEVSRRQFELFHAVVIEEWPTEKAMQVFDASRAAVYQAKHRILPRYRELLRAVVDELEAPPPTPSEP